MTFIRAAYLLENWAPVLPATAAGKLPTFLPPDRALPMVATRDVGAVAAAALLEGPAGARQIMEVVGPREFSPNDVAAALAELRGRPVQARGGAAAGAAGGAGRGRRLPAFAEQVRLMYASIERSQLVLGAGARLCRGPTDLPGFFRPLLAAA